MADQENRDRELFNLALEQKTPAERSAYLDSACGNDPALRTRIEALLRASDEAGGFLQEGATGLTDAHDGVSEGPGSWIGRYRLLEPIGEGGFGVVYMAEQLEPVHRRVALKIIKMGMDTRAVVARFEAERQALAMMDHPNIAKVLDGGATASGRPYFVMELVRGIPITAFCDEHRLTMRERIKLLMTVSQAVQHAHQKGVIHRDLKPSNILVMQDGERPVPLVIDFGVAKATAHRLTEKTLFTRFHQFVGTPAYMSPEQTGATGADVDTRSDIYSLGVVLYELLAGRPPFDTETLAAAGYAEIERTIRERDPLCPSQRLAALGLPEQTTTAGLRRTEPARLVSHIRGDLDLIVMKCLQKDRARRYETTNGLAMDLGRYLGNQPVLARPDTISYRLGKFIRRNRVSVSSATVVLVVLVAGLAGTYIEFRRAEMQRQRADEQRDRALRQLSRADAINDLNSFLLVEAASSGRPITVEELLERAEKVVDRESADSEENRVGMLVTIGGYYWSLDLDRRAREILEKAYARAVELPNVSLRAYAGAALARSLARTGEFDRAERLIQQALDDLRAESDNGPTMVFCLECGSQVARDRGDSAGGVARAEAAQAVAQESALGSGQFRLSVAMDLAESYRMAGRNREASVAFEQAWAQMESLGRSETENAGTLLNNWGLALFNLGRSREAAAMFRRAIAIKSADVSADSVSPMLLNNLARALVDLGQIDEAAALAEQANTRARILGDETIVNQSLLNLVRIDLDRGETERAAEELAEVELRLKRVLPEGHYAFGTVSALRSTLDLDRGDADAALIAADQAVTIVESAGQGGEYLAPFLLRRVEVYLRLRQFELARADADRALLLEQQSSDPGAMSVRLGRTWMTLAHVYDGQGDGKAARAAYGTAFEHLHASLGDDHPLTREAAGKALSLERVVP